MANKKESKRIVIVEDDMVILKALNIQLLDAGYKVLFASDGETGFRLIKKEAPDLILLDLVLPKLNGFELLKKIQKNPKTKKIPVLVLSNLGQDQDIEKARKLGASCYCIKSSTDLKNLVKKINRII